MRISNSVESVVLMLPSCVDLSEQDHLPYVDLRFCIAGSIWYKGIARLMMERRENSKHRSGRSMLD